MLYTLLTIGVLVQSPVLRFDTYLVDLHLWRSHPSWHPWIYYYVMFGQRGPATLVFLPFFLWVAWRKRTTQPLVLLVTALILLNFTVGVVKYAIGRIGPLHSDDVHAIFAGGNIYPSGHVSNTVVLYGLVAWIAPRFRKSAIAGAVFLSITVGLGTVYLRTHWFSDVVGGWIAGGLVLLALPSLMPAAQRFTDGAIARARARFAHRRAADVAAVTGVAPPGRHVEPPVRHVVQRKLTPVKSVANSHSRVATVSSFDAVDESTRCGSPRNSPSPSGP